MSGVLLLDWAGLAVSLFNTLVLAWLGLTVLLNAERRTWGMWLAGGGLLGGALFFICHTALLGHGTALLTPGQELWWNLGGLSVVALPFAWYLVMLWYGGCWETPQSRLWRRQRLGFGGALALLAGLVGLILARAVPTLGQLSGPNPGAGLAGTPTRFLLLVYPVYILTCVGLSIDALLHPNPSQRVMGDAARQRARPWLVGTSVSLLGAGLLVGGVLFWVIETWAGGRWVFRWNALDPLFGGVDLAIAGCIAVSVVLLGQAVARYEIFTGKTLPQRGLTLLWQRVAILAAGYSLVVGGSLAVQLQPIYILLLSTLLLAAFFALLGWRQYAERERWMLQLRPIVSSQQLYDRALAGDDGSHPPQLLAALCQEVLGVQKASLYPLGALEPLVGSPLSYPEGDPPDEMRGWVSRWTEGCTGEAKSGTPLDPQHAGGYLWAAPLWRQQSLAGLLFLGEKRDGGLFTREEIALAQAAGEQILDALASAELARRLIHLQRQQMAESQVFDRQLRRALHDDILPQVHEILLAVNRLETSQPGERQAVLDDLTGLHHQVSSLLRGLKPQAGVEVSRFGLVHALQSMVEGELAGSFEQVDWQVQPAAGVILQALSPVALEVLFYAAREAIRNAAYHAQQPGGKAACLRVEIMGESGLEIRIQDNGGRWPERHAGNLRGSGSGLVLHSTMMSILGGTLQMERAEGEVTQVRLSLPREAVGRLGREVNQQA